MSNPGSATYRFINLDNTTIMIIIIKSFKMGGKDFNYRENKKKTIHCRGASVAQWIERLT